MELMEALRTRRSVRRFTDELIDDEALARLVEAAAWAPSGSDLQPWAFVIVRFPKNVRRLRAVSPGVIGAPTAFIAICLDSGRALGERGTEGYDNDLLTLGGAMQNLLLAAHDAGLGACAIGSFHAASVRSILDLPPHLEPKLLVALGVPAVQPPAPARRPMEEICFIENVGARP